MFQKSENLKKFQKILNFLKIFFHLKIILFVFQYYDNAIWPELSSPAQSWEKNLKKSRKMSNKSLFPP